MTRRPAGYGRFFDKSRAGQHLTADRRPTRQRLQNDDKEPT